MGNIKRAMRYLGGRPDVATYDYRIEFVQEVVRIGKEIRESVQADNSAHSRFLPEDIYTSSVNRLL